MTATARDLLSAFEGLDPAEKQQVAAEILRRSAGTDGISDEAFDQIASEVFRAYDAEEAAGTVISPRR